MEKTFYSAYGLRLQSEIPLPQLPLVAHGEADVRILLGSLSAELEPLTTIDKIARYCVRRGQEIIVDPMPGADPVHVAHCLCTSAFAVLLAQRGCLALHACAVDSTHGAVLLVGAAGIGKSTMAAALVDAGHPLLSDDFTAVIVRDGAVWVLPSSPELCLWGNHLAYSGLDPSNPIRPGVKKFRVPVQSWTNTARPLRATIYLPEAASTAVSLEPMSEDEAFVELTTRVYRWRLLAGNGLSTEPIQKTLTLLARGAPSFLLRRPRALNKLAEACRKIEAEISDPLPKKASALESERAVPVRPIWGIDSGLLTRRAPWLRAGDFLPKVR